jgi:hypothetical protein
MARGRRRGLAALVLATVAALAAACGGGTGDDDAAPATLVVDDRTTLEVPAGALPDDISIDDIAVEPGGLTLLRAAPGDPEPLAAYRLEPSGISFSTPLTLRLAVSLDQARPATVAVLLSEEQGQPELVATSLEDVDPDAGTATIAVALPHFSELVIHPDLDFDATLSAPASALVGEGFEVEVTVIRNPDYSTVYRQVRSGFVVTSTFEPDGTQPWQLSGYVAASGAASGLFFDRPPLTSVGTNTFTVRQSLQCERAGQAQIAYQADVIYFLLQITHEEEDDSTRTETHRRRINVYGSGTTECVAAGATAPPPPRPPTPESTGTAEASGTAEATGTADATETAAPEPTGRPGFSANLGDRRSDPLDCTTEEPTAGELAPQYDIVQVVAMEIATGLQVTVYFAASDLEALLAEAGAPWLGGIGIDRAEVPNLTDPDWHFNEVFDLGFNWGWDPATEQLGVFVVDLTIDGGAPIPGAAFPAGFVAPNGFTVVISVEQLPEQSWSLNATITDGTLCDALPAPVEYR